MPAVSFSGTGFLYPYQIGCAEYIKETFEVDQLLIGSISGGFTAAISILFNVTPSQHYELLEEAKDFWNKRMLGPFLNSTSNWIGPYLKMMTKFDSRLECINGHGRLTLGCTSLVPYKRLNVDYFHSIDHLAYSISCSQRLFPFYRTVGFVEKKLVVDGVFSQRFAIPKTVSHQDTVKVSPFRLLVPDIYPSGQTINYLKKIYTPPDRSCFFNLVEQGYQDAKKMSSKFLQRGFKLKSIA
ncbi:MAG: hypothetical protein HRU09_19870 [Oligoflexales bacterium]|nr:hypothetical protein [Oligoflexales bacterium]